MNNIALHVVPKIFYKQNPKDNTKGADSVHVVLDEKENFTLWLKKCIKNLQIQIKAVTLQRVKEMRC